MIKPDHWMTANARALGINPACVNPVSVDLTVGSRAALVTYSRFGGHLKYRELDLTRRGHLDLRPGSRHFYLLHSAENIALPPDVMATLFLKSTVARSGVDHALAGLIEPGFHGQVTLELSVKVPTRLLLGERVVQLMLHETGTVHVPYGLTGRYNGQTSWQRALAPRYPDGSVVEPVTNTLAGLTWAERVAALGLA
ncbi:dCTP deaminase [Deinococcus kurensis]|uniref:dCTP deaminase n=1 Tax=Deinococcus kurensis TaxID=2662757 RepID=UPI0012D34CF3|nr:hypothetical protein [Deinococcus kurensis]